MPTIPPQDQRSRIEALFEAALDRAPETRAEYLDRACDGDPVLRAEVSALLAAHHRTQGLLDANAAEAAWSLLEDRPAGKRIGAYRLLRELGRGGMGTVYLAERDDGQFHHRVAIKLIGPGLPSAELVARFLAERQILASLDHPQIARLLDGGVTGQGYPYYVMEYVDGMPLDQYCERRSLSVEDRVRLVSEVARAVHYAHRNLVVHRDLKPSNILVTDEGRVKLLDFGIAKLMERNASVDISGGLMMNGPGGGPGIPGGAPLTVPGARLMTPEYASPEQVRGEAVTTATDVYALGVVLYEILAGVRPFVLAGRRLDQLELVISRTEPPPLSSAAPPERRRRLRGDLERIVATALMKEPERRYGSAQQLAEDLGRHLTGRPVLARSDSAMYRAGTFIRRHRGGLAAALLLLLLLSSYAITLTVQNRRVAAALAESRLAADNAAELNDFLLGLFEPRGTDAATDSLVIGTLLARGEERAAQVTDNPAAATVGLTALGRVQRHLGRYAEAARWLEQALVRARDRYGEAHLQVAEIQWLLADVYRMVGRRDTAEALLRRALGTIRAQLGDRHRRVGSVLNQLALIQRDDGRLDEAEQAAREALAVRRATLDSADADISASLVVLGSILRRQGRLAEAEPYYLEVVQRKRRDFQGDHQDVAVALNNLGILYNDMGRYAAAESLYRQALDMNRRVLGDDHPYVATGMTNLGQTLTRMGKLGEAESLIRGALERRRRALGDDHPDVAVDLQNLGLVLRAEGRRDEADRALREALALRRRVLGVDHPLTRETEKAVKGER